MHCYFCVLFVSLQFKDKKKGRFIVKPLSSVVRPGESVLMTLKVASKDQKMLIIGTIALRVDVRWTSLGIKFRF